MAVSASRKRRTWVRSQRGCKTCRARHVKCDETYPSCKRCATAGRACDGCAAPSDEWEIITVSSASSKSSSLSPTPEKWPNARQYDDQASSCLAFFRQHTIAYLADLLDRDCKPLIFRAVEQNDVLYHAALAMGSVHKIIMTKKDLRITLHEDTFATKQYTKALRSLAPENDKATEVPIEIVLTACLLFIGLENLRGNYGVVLQHVRSGTNIMQQHLANARGAERRLIPLRSLLPAFARLERQLQELTGLPSPLIQALAEEQSSTGFFNYAQPEPQAVPVFTDLNAAWIGLHQRWHSLISWVGFIHIDWFNHMGDVHKDSNVFATPWDAEPTLKKRHAELTQDFHIWSLGLADLRSHLQQLSLKEEAVYALLQCHAVLAKMVLDTASLPREILWDEHTDDFAEIVRLCRRICELEVLDTKASFNDHALQVVVHHRHAPSMEHISASADPDDQRCVLTFEMGICMILLHVISKCRDARVRLDAIKLLEEYPRLEGLWDSAVIAKSGRAMDEVERHGETLEEAAQRHAPASAILPEHRIVDLRAVLHMNSRSGDLFMYTNKRVWEPDAMAKRRTIDW